MYGILTRPKSSDFSIKFSNMISKAEFHNHHVITYNPNKISPFQTLIPPLIAPHPHKTCHLQMEASNPACFHLDFLSLLASDLVFDLSRFNHLRGSSFRDGLNGLFLHAPLGLRGNAACMAWAAASPLHRSSSLSSLDLAESLCYGVVSEDLSGKRASIYNVKNRWRNKQCSRQHASRSPKNKKERTIMPSCQYSSFLEIMANSRAGRW